MCNCKCKDLWDYIDWNDVLESKELDKDFLIEHLDEFNSMGLISNILNNQHVVDDNFIKLLEDKNMLTYDVLKDFRYLHHFQYSKKIVEKYLTKFYYNGQLPDIIESQKCIDDDFLRVIINKFITVKTVQKYYIV